MRGFSFKNEAFIILIATLVWLSTSAICNAATTGRYWRHGGGQLQVHVDKSKPREGLKFNVLDYGAKGNGASDDTKAFQTAWANACKAEGSMMIVPLGYKFLVRPTSFSGSNCHKNIVLQLDGTIMAPTDSKAWDTGPDQWLEFTNLVGFTLKGKGTLDGRGSVWWTKSIYDFKQVSSSEDGKKQQSKPAALIFVGGSKLTVTGITIRNSPQFHLTFDSCDGVLVHDISISSPGDSPNTDGIHLRTTKNGAKGLVQGVSFSNIQVSEVEVPIMIDQYYCAHSTCKNRTSAVSIADIAYENIRGTYTVQPLHLSCSDIKPCMNINLSGIELKPKLGHQMSEPFCWEAFGRLNGPIIPEIDCLKEGQSSNRRVHHDAKCAA
ncbi:hypothetical protein L1987_41588 [Smallanthus sonchifolius]|uniref:Uncharacterized protein n=1 Tax=Smallanthus sonchifolius TaxID=185202 RepID=A0ACB9GW09_9ASTR|nr:hypothetical protein L1987_41588 [Smallanthus sonchifolius]